MIVINGFINNDSFPDKTPKTSTAAPLSVRMGRPRKEPVKPAENQKEISHNLRTIKKNNEEKNSKKLRIAMKKVAAAAQRESPRKKAKFNIVTKNRGVDVKKPQKVQQQRPRGRPPKNAVKPNKTNKDIKIKSQKSKGKS